MRSSSFAAHLLAAVLLAQSAVMAPDLHGQTPPPPQRCDTPEFRQFDFWIGDWNVTSEGEPAGTNLVTLEEAGCVVHEHWTGAEGGTGQSFNYYDRLDKRWHQMWVSNSGNVLDLAGTFADGALIFRGERPAQRVHVEAPPEFPRQPRRHRAPALGNLLRRRLDLVHRVRRPLPKEAGLAAPSRPSPPNAARHRPAPAAPRASIATERHVPLASARHTGGLTRTTPGGRMRRRTLLLWGLSGICSLTLACSEDESGPTAAAPAQSAAALDDAALSLYGLAAGPGCRTAPYRQFDFWLGSWEVAVNGNPPRAASFITSELDGCAILENWHGALGGTGRSLNGFDAADGQWHQH